jgi:hypothetical protein
MGGIITLGNESNISCQNDEIIFTSGYKMFLNGITYLLLTPKVRFDRLNVTSYYSFPLVTLSLSKGVPIFSKVRFSKFNMKQVVANLPFVTLNLSKGVPIFSKVRFSKFNMKQVLQTFPLSP